MIDKYIINYVITIFEFHGIKSTPTVVFSVLLILFWAKYFYDAFFKNYIFQIFK